MPGTIVNSSTTGIKKLVYAIMTDEVAETYSAVKNAPPLINIKIAPKVDSGTLYADNIAVETATVVGDIAIDFEVQDMPLEVQADFLGHELNALTGTLTYNVNDKAPYVALGYERTKGNGKSRYVWLLKAKFQEIEEEAKTKEDKVAFQTPKVTGTAIANKAGVWKRVADDDTKGTTITDFLATVPGTTVDLIAPTVTTVPIDAATGILGTADILATFDKAINTSTITPSNIFVMKADGTAIATTLSIGTNNTVVTIHPITTLTTGAYIIVITTNVKAASGVAIASNYVVNFTI